MVTRLVKSPALWILLGTVLIITILMWLRPEPPRAPTEEQSWPVRVTEVQPQTLSPQLQLLGRVESSRVSTLTASIVAGVDAVPALEGDRVRAGDLLVTLDRQEAALGLRQAEADLANLAAQIRQEKTRAAFDRETLSQQQSLVAAAQRTVEREQRLERSDLSSAARLDEARTSLAAAQLNLINQRLVIANMDARLDGLQAQLARAEALRDRARLDLNRADIRAPFDGVITAVTVSPGERVRTGDPLVTLYASGALEIRAQLPERWLPIVREAAQAGADFTATAITANDRYPLVLERLTGQVNPGAGGVDALFRFQRQESSSAPRQSATDAPVQPLLLGRTLEIVLSLPAVSDVFAVPISALYGTNQLFKVEDGHLESVVAEILGDRFTADVQQILVRSPGLAAGDQVVTTQLPNAVAGLKVSLPGANSDVPPMPVRPDSHQ